MIITKDNLKTLCPNTSMERLEVMADTINAKAAMYGITSKVRMAHFVSQVAHESAGLTRLVENLNYSLQGLRATFPKYFKTDQQAASYARKPVAIANRVYAQRLGNGTEASGDGWKFRGRGCIQITGKDNYKAVKRGMGVDVVSNPDLLMEPALAMESAMWWWNANGLNAIADKDDVTLVTRRVNGGTNGLADRKALYAKMVAILSMTN